MKFGPVPTDAAGGGILAHSLTLPEGRISKGTRLAAADIERLRAAGIAEVTVARLEPGDIEENAAAEWLAQAVAPDPADLGLRATRAGAGRVNLYATGPGCVLLDPERIRAINAVDPMVTIATLAPFARVEAGTMVATIKIISYAVAEAALHKAGANAAGAVRRAAPVLNHATLIETQVGDRAPSAKGRGATQARLERLGLSLGERVIVPHRVAALAGAISSAPGDLILILTASATSDARDVAPEALRQAGGQVETFGMPVDPGNLLFFGELAGRPVIGLPGCARSPALNGADWVLERVACGLTGTPALDIAGMGVGGLLKESPARPHPRES